MKKEEFLNKLREKISILKKEEQDDIINEYNEHIEEKLKKKEKEEDIIKELGDIDEIAKEILDAYKINEEYSNKKTGVKGSGMGWPGKICGRKSKNIIWRPATACICRTCNYYTAGNFTGRRTDG